MSRYDGRVKIRGGTSFSGDGDVGPRILQLLLKVWEPSGASAPHMGDLLFSNRLRTFCFFSSQFHCPALKHNTVDWVRTEVCIVLFTSLSKRGWVRAWPFMFTCFQGRDIEPARLKMTLCFRGAGWLYLKFHCGVWYGESVDAALRTAWLEDCSAVHEGGRSVLHHASFHLCWGEREKIILFLNSEKPRLVWFQQRFRMRALCDSLRFVLSLLMGSMEYVTFSNLPELETEYQTRNRLARPRVLNDLGTSLVRCCERGCWRCPVAPAAGAATPCCWRRPWSAAAPAGQWRPSAAAPDSEAAPSPPGRSSAPPAAARPCLWLSSPAHWEWKRGDSLNTDADSPNDQLQRSAAQDSPVFGIQLVDFVGLDNQLLF